MRILYISYYYWPPHFGGGLIHTIERLEEMIKRGHSVTVVTSGSPGYPTQEIQNGLHLYRSKRQEKSSRVAKFLHHISYTIATIHHLFTQKFDILHIGSLPGFNQFSSLLIGLLFNWIAHFRKAKVVYLFSLADRSDQVFVMNGISGRLRKQFFCNIDKIVVNSPQLFEAMNDLFKPQVHMILNGTKDQVFHPDPKTRNEVRSNNGIAQNAIIYTFIGTISKRKGVDILLNSFEYVKKEVPNAILWLIGPGSIKENQNIDENEASIIIERLNNLPSITQWGRVDDRDQLAQLLCASDVFVFPTRREGMPMALLQAMSAGLPVIVTRLKGVTDMVNIEGVTGYFIEPGEEEQLAKIMVTLANNPQLRESLGQSARKRIEESFSWKEHIDEWEGLYTTH